MRRILIVVPGLKTYLPYVETYELELFQLGYQVDVLEWDRFNKRENCDRKLIFSRHSAFSGNPIARLFDYLQFCSFCKKYIDDNDIHLVIVCTLAPLLFLSPALEKKNIKYVCDIRDYSPIVKYFNKYLTKSLSRSVLNIISSNGFKLWLPPSCDYLILNNISQFNFNGNSLEYEFGKQINIYTIGYIRDLSANIHLIKKLGNKFQFKLNFIGEGPSEKSLIKYSKLHNIKNVFFFGQYSKSCEFEFYKKSTFINIYMEDNLASKTLMSNRFYNSLMCFRPMIVRKGSCQAYYVEKFNLGISVSENDDLEEMIIKYINSYNKSEFLENCRNCLSVFLEQNRKTYNKLFEIIDI